MNLAPPTNIGVKLGRDDMETRMLIALTTLILGASPSNGLFLRSIRA